MLISIQTPVANDRGPVYSEQFFAAIHEANRERFPVTFAFARQQADTVSLHCRFDSSIQALVQGQLLARYPDARISRLPDDAFECPAGCVPFVAELRLRPDIFPIRRHPQFVDESSRETADPIVGILEALGSAQYPARIEIVTTPVGSWRQRIVAKIRQVWPQVRIIIRGDSGFCREKIMRFCEENQVDFILGLAKNNNEPIEG